MVVLSYYRQEPSGTAEHTRLLSRLSDIPGGSVEKLKLETCFYVLTSDKDISKEDEEKLLWIFGKSFQEEKLGKESFLAQEVSNDKLLLEIGPRLNFSTAFSTNAVSICQSVGLNKISRIEKSLRHLISFTEATTVTPEFEACISSKLHDRMTHCRYTEAVQDFGLNVTPDDVFEVDILGEGRSALERANKELGLAFDDWDLDYYTSLFTDKIKRNPTSVECFDLAQSNSEHSRHWFFRGRLVIDEQEHEKSLFKMVMSTQDHTNNNNVIKFSDNSSAIEGFDVRTFQPENPSEPSSMAEKDVRRHIIFTAETHNFPTGVAPFPGATTGTGGRIRDVQSAGRGAHVVAGTAGYCFGNLQIPDYKLPWEDDTFKYPSNFASPLDIAIEASNGASDYGNKFGEPVLAGFARSFGLSLPGGERREYIKPIMFSGGIGQLEDCHIEKGIPEEGMLVAKIGGPVYRIGVGGGAASSVQVQGDNKSELDFGAVQRGDAEMEQKLNRLIRGCIEMSDKNPIVSIHDQGAGGNGNVLKEIVEPAGAIIQADQFQLADPTISILELWGAEYQESNAVLLNQHNKELLTRMGTRERCPIAFVGTVTGDGKIRLENFKQKEAEGSPVSKKQKLFSAFPVDLELEHVLGSMPRKVFKLDRMKPNLTPLSLPENIQIRETLERVLRLPSVASKRYLTNKVDRCVTGLVAQQQCVGPLHTPLADVAVTTLSYFDMVGSATAIGEQPIKGLIDPACGARMSVGEALTNLVFAKITSLKDVKCSSNWMWPAKLPGEGAALYDACKAMCDVMEKLGIAVDGGKDSLSMAARVDDVTVKAPGTLVVSAYVGCPDISLTVTPDLKCPNSKGVLLHIDLSRGKHRLGGSALAQCQEQIGDESPDLEDPQLFSRAFNVTQSLITERLLSAGHDISDGGLITCVMEMAFAGNCGIEVDIITKEPDIPAVDVYFAEELGLLLEVAEINLHKVLQAYSDQNVPCVQIGYSQRLTVNEVQLMLNGHEILVENMTVLRDIWEETSFQLEKRQASPCCVEQESTGLKYRISPPYHLSFDPEIICFMPKEGTVNQWYRSASKHDRPRAKVAVLREEGSNSDREMAAVLHMAGFTVWDINMQDLCSGEITLDEFEGLVFVGGFSYADVCGSAKGWAATAVFNKKVHDQLTKFRERTDTFSLGVCNGCQLMALLGWVAPDSAVSESGDQDFQQGVLLDHNASERFECRFSTVKVYNSPSIMLTGLEGTTFGMWSAHGEGRMVFKTPLIKSEVLQENLAPVRYVDDENQPTVVYPFNPNGSPDGIAALCSVDGRHLAIMPHPERCFLPWQCPWIPESLQGKLDVTPWFKMFQNAFDWCMKHKQS